MPVFLDARGVPVCDHCGYSLIGLPTRGTCPECGQWYTTTRVVMAPGFRRRRLAICDWVFSAPARLWPSLRAAAILLLVLGNAALLIGIAAYAWRTFTRATGMP